MNKTIAIAGMVFALATGGAAYAQDNATSETGTSAIDQPFDTQKMGTFYTDEGRTTLKTGDDFNSAWNALSADDQKNARKNCENPEDNEAEFCRSVGQMTGNNSGL